MGKKSGKAVSSENTPKCRLKKLVPRGGTSDDGSRKPKTGKRGAPLRTSLRNGVKAPLRSQSQTRPIEHLSISDTVVDADNEGDGASFSSSPVVSPSTPGRRPRDVGALSPPLEFADLSGAGATNTRAKVAQRASSVHDSPIIDLSTVDEVSLTDTFGGLLGCGSGESHSSRSQGGNLRGDEQLPLLGQVLVEDVDSDSDASSSVGSQSDSFTTPLDIGKVKLFRLFYDGSFKKSLGGGWAYNVVEVVGVSTDHLFSKTPMFSTVNRVKANANLLDVGSVIIEGKGPVQLRDESHFLHTGVEKVTNVSAELSALSLGLRAFHRLVLNRVAEGDRQHIMLQIVGDNIYSLMAAAGLSAVREKKIKWAVEYVRRTLHAIQQLIGGIHMLHVLSHGKKGGFAVRFNKKVDEEAFKGISIEDDNPLLKADALCLQPLDFSLGESAIDVHGIYKNLFSCKDGSAVSFLANIRPRPTELKEAAKFSKKGVFMKGEVYLAEVVSATLLAEQAIKCRWVQHRNRQDIHLIRSDGKVVKFPLNTKLVDIPLECLGGVFAAMARTDTYVPFPLRNLVASAYNTVLRAVVRAVEDSNGSEVEVCLAFKKFFLMGILMHSERGRHSRHIVEARIASILQDDWSKFCLNDFRLRSVMQGSSNSENVGDDHATQKLQLREDDILQKKVVECVKAGEIGNGAHRLLSSAKPAEVVPEVIDKLRSLFVSPVETPVQLESSEVSQLVQSQQGSVSVSVTESQPLWVPILESDYEMFAIDEHRVHSLLRKLSRMVAPGLDGIRYNHLRNLVSSDEAGDPVRYGFLELLTKLINVYLSGRLPTGLNAFIASAEIFPLSKKNGGIRPIMLINSFRKLAALCVVEQFGSDMNMQYFRNLQLGICRKFGMESIIHCMSALLRDRSSLDFMFADFQNAFNLVKREKVLAAVNREGINLYKNFFKAIYGHDSSAWVFSTEGVTEIASKLGVHQGDPLGCIAFALAVHELFEEVEALATDGCDDDTLGSVKAYIDDLSVGASFDRMMKIIQHIMVKGNDYGVVFNKEKTVILIGKCSSFDVALARQKWYTDQGFLVSNVIIHPCNVAEDQKLRQEELYGCICLGAPIGCDRYVSMWLSNKLESLRFESQVLADFAGPMQCKMLMLRFSFAQKINHLLRCLPPSLTNDFAKNFDALKISVFSKILGIDSRKLNTLQQAQILTHIRDGGFGLGNSAATAPAAYVASVTTSLASLSRTLKHYESTLSVPWVNTQFATETDICLTRGLTNRKFSRKIRKFIAVGCLFMLRLLFALRTYLMLHLA